MTKLSLALLSALFAFSVVDIAPASAKTDGLWSHDSNIVVDKRRKKRVPGGSGCDDPEDIIEHPECTP